MISSPFFSHGYNLLLHGLGSKRHLLEDFRRTKLKDFSHVVVNGYFPSMTVKSVSVMWPASSWIWVKDEPWGNWWDEVWYVPWNPLITQQFFSEILTKDSGVGGLWGFLWWAPSAKRKDYHRVSSGWSSVWHRSNTGLSSTQYEQIPIILGVWPFWLTPFFFRSITFWRAYG